jgi:anti-sigma factor RsiW
MTCSHYEHLWEDYLDGRADAAVREELDAHLSRCPACREAVDAARASGPLLRALLEPAPEPGLGFWTRVQADIREAENANKDFWGSLEKLAWRISWAATLAVALMVGYVATSESDLNNSTNEQSEIRALVPDPAPRPANKDEVLLSLAGNGR